MPSETLHFENARFVQQLLNNDAQNLHALENLLGLQATTRDGWIKLDGPLDAIERGRQFLQVLEAAVKSALPPVDTTVSPACLAAAVTASMFCVRSWMRAAPRS